MLERPEKETKSHDRHRGKIYAIALFTFALIVIACIPGTGYRVVGTGASPAAVVSGGVGESHSVNRVFNCYIQVQFNPLLYPISYLMGNENVFKKFRGAAEFWDYEAAQLTEAATLGTLLTEVARNLPYFIVTGLLAALLTSELANTSTIRKLMPKPRT